MYRTLAMVVLTGFGFTPAHPADEQPKPTKFEMTKVEKRLLELTNAERKKEELPLLKAAPLLFQSARAHSANMAKQGKMEHELDGKTPFQRIKGAGYQYYLAGENIAFGPLDLKLVMKGWMDSEGHRKNILHKGYTEIGLGVVQGGDGYYYYTQVFGTPSKR
ncbi:MAG: CAP domain-containing protein [Planctomycetes bacterium]|nr:CAP domain-containing protein [Planctomycetota bacterium]